MEVHTLIATVSSNFIANKIHDVPNASYDSDYNIHNCLRQFFSGLPKKDLQKSSFV